MFYWQDKQKSTGLKCKWENRVVELLLPNKTKNSFHKRTEQARNLVQQKMWITGLAIVWRSIRNNCVTYRKSGAQAMAGVMAQLPIDRLVASTFLQLLN